MREPAVVQSHHSNRSRVSASGLVSHLSCVHNDTVRSDEGDEGTGSRSRLAAIDIPRGCPRPSRCGANEARSRAVVAEGMRLATKTPGSHAALDRPPASSGMVSCFLMAPLNPRASGCMQHPHEPRGTKSCCSVARFPAEGTRSGN